jgi:hypothetical protein
MGSRPKNSAGHGWRAAAREPRGDGAQSHQRAERPKPENGSIGICQASSANPIRVGLFAHEPFGTASEMHLRRRPFADLLVPPEGLLQPVGVHAFEASCEDDSILYGHGGAMGHMRRHRMACVAGKTIRPPLHVGSGSRSVTARACAAAGPQHAANLWVMLPAPPRRFHAPTRTPVTK